MLKKPKLRAEIVSWDNFNLSRESTKNLETIKQRITKRQKTHKKITSCEVNKSDVAKRKIEQKMYDIGNSLDEIIRNICAANTLLPPLEIDKNNEGQNEISIYIRFEGTSLKKYLTVIIKLCLLDFAGSVVQVQCVGVLSDQRFEGEPKLIEELYEGVFDEVFVESKLDGAIHKIFDQALQDLEQESGSYEKDKAGQNFKLILLNHSKDDSI